MNEDRPTTIATVSLEPRRSGTRKGARHALSVKWSSGAERLVAEWLAPTSPERPVVVLLHGLAMSGASWGDVADTLHADGHGVLVPDLPGHGESTMLPGHVTGTATFGEMADRLLAVLDAVGGPRVVLAGFSMGATVACELAWKCRDRAVALVLVDPVLQAPVVQLAHAHPSSFLALLARTARQAFRQRALALAVAWMVLSVIPLPRSAGRGVHALMARARRAGRAPVKTDNDVAVFAAGLVTTPWEVVAGCIDAMHRLPLAHVEPPRVPTLLATGENDAIAPPAWVARVAARTRGDFDLVRGADHVSLARHSGEVGRLISGWLGRVCPPGGA